MVGPGVDCQPHQRRRHRRRRVRASLHGGEAQADNNCHEFSALLSFEPGAQYGRAAKTDPYEGSSFSLKLPHGDAELFHSACLVATAGRGRTNAVPRHDDDKVGSLQFTVDHLLRPTV